MVGISLVTLAPGRMGGAEVYARSLTHALHEVGRLDYLVAVPPDARDASGGLPAVTTGAPGTSARSVALARSAFASRALRAADVVHFPLTIPLPWARAKRVITLHDVLHRDLPELVSRSTRAFRLVGYDRASRGADLVIVPSEFVRDRAVATLGLDRGRVRVVAHGVDHDLFRPGGEAREPFLLYPARFWPHKNHEALFEAFASVRRERPDLELVLTGGGHEGRALPTGVRSVGLVPEAELARLYRTAELMVFPSLYEGFGTPLVEAMASGCPVAASNAGSLPEVAGDAAALFDPSSRDSIASGIFQAFAARDELAARGLERARRFTWEAAATAHESAYEELLPRDGRC